MKAFLWILLWAGSKENITKVMRLSLDAGNDYDFGLREPLFGIGALNSIQLYFIPIPRRNVDRAVDIIQFNAAVGRKRIGVMKFLGQCSAIGGMRSKCEHEQSANTSEGRAQPGSEIASAVHESLHF